MELSALSPFGDFLDNRSRMNQTEMLTIEIVGYVLIATIGVLCLVANFIWRTTRERRMHEQPLIMGNAVANVDQV